MDPQGRGKLQATLLAQPIFVGNKAAKNVLTYLAVRACNECGLAWCGVWLIAKETEWGERAVRDALAVLVFQGHLKQGRYGKGGRGMATEYIVLPGIRELSPAPCGKCTFNQRNGAGHAGFDKDQTPKPRTPRRVSSKPGTPGSNTLAFDKHNTNSATPSPATGHENKTRENASATLIEQLTLSKAMPEETASPLTSEPPHEKAPPTAQDARTKAEAQVRDLREHFGASYYDSGHPWSSEAQKPTEGETARPRPTLETEKGEKLRRLGYVED